MKYLLIGALNLLLISTGRAQVASLTPLEYCEFELEPIFASNLYHLRVDYGQERKKGLFYDVEKLRDPQTQEILVFNSEIAALNYMGSQGWELVQVLADSSCTHYLLRRPKVAEPTSLPEAN